MKKFCAALMFVIFAGLFNFLSTFTVEAADKWIYTDSNGYEYYVRNADRDARTWASAVVIKVRNNYSNSLLYIFEAYNDVPYKVFNYRGGYSFDYRNGDCGYPIESSDNIYSSPIATKIWNDYIPHPTYRD